MLIDTWVDSRGRVPESHPHGSLNYFYRAFLLVSFGQSFWFAWFRVHIFCISGFSQVCTHNSWPRRVLLQRPIVEYLLASLPFDLQGAALSVCSQEGLLISRRRNMWSGQGPASSLNCPAVVILDFWSIENESPTTLAWRVIYLPLHHHQCCPHGLWLGKELSRTRRGRHGTVRRAGETPLKGFPRRQLADWQCTGGKFWQNISLGSLVVDMLLWPVSQDVVNWSSVSVH